MDINSKNSVKEREINLVDLFVDILLRWRMIIVCMVIGAILFGGLSYATSFVSVQKQNAVAQQQENELEKGASVEENKQQQLEKKLTDTQISNVVNTLAYEQMYKDREAYKEQSIFMNIDPLNVQRGDITFLVRAEDKDETYSIQKVYEDLVVSAGMLEYVQNTCEIEYNANELIFLERTSYDLIEGSNTIRVCIIYDDREMCEKIAKSVVAYIEEQELQLVNVLGEHTIEVISQTIFTVVNDSYATLQKNCETELITYRNNISTLKTKFTEDEWNYYDYLTMGDIEREEEQSMLSEDVNYTPQISKKIILLGMFFFAFLYVFCIFLRYILNNKLRATESLTDIYNIAQLGFIPANGRKKKLLGFIDKWINSIRDYNRRNFTTEEAISMAAVAIKMAARKYPSDTVYLVGCDIKKQTMEVCQEIQEFLSKENIEVSILDNVIYNVETMASLENANCVVLVEKANSTLYNEVTEELELLRRQDITVLGGIVIE